MKKKKNLFVLGMLLAAALSACQKSPDSSIVKNKDLDKMIDEAKGGSGNVGDLAGNYDTYQTEIKDDSLHVTVNVDAKVDIPQTDKMSVIRASQKKIDQELVDKVRKALMQEEKLYDGSVLNVQTRSDIESEIQAWKREMAGLEASEKELKKEYQENIDALQKQYEKAPVERDFEQIPSDGKLRSIKELYEKDKGNSFYSWEYSLNQKGDVYYAVNNGKSSGDYRALYAQNSEEYGNCIRYSRDKQDYVNIAMVPVGGDSCTLGYWEAGKEVKEDDLLIKTGLDNLEEQTNMTATISQEEAQEKAEKLLKDLELSDFQYYEGGLFCEIPNRKDPGANEKIGYRKVYRLNYLRNIDGVFVNNEGESKMTDEWQGDNYVKKEWSGEHITILVNDDGIIGFYYEAPIQTTDVVVEKASMKSFDEIKNIFEHMVVVTNARSKGNEEEDAITIDVDRVILRYTRISEADSYDTGLLVPVWDFMGKVTDVYGEKGYKRASECVLTINAIDGTVIDRRLGY